MGRNGPVYWASGAIPGVMGAYVVLVPRPKILTLMPIIIFFFTVRLPAVLILGYRFLIQFLRGFLSSGEINQAGMEGAYRRLPARCAFALWILTLNLYVRFRKILARRGSYINYSSTTLLTVSCSMRSRRGRYPIPGSCKTLIVPARVTVTSGSMISSVQ